MSICLMLDVDGVLVSGRPHDGLLWTHDLKKDMGVDPDELIQQFFVREWRDVVTGKRDLIPTLSHSLRRIGARVSAEELVSYWFEMDSRLVRSVLADCRRAREWGHQVYLATSQEHLRARYLMETLGLMHEVDGMICSAEAGFQKPDPMFFNYAASITRRESNEMLLVDDTLANIEGARSSGWHAVHWDGKQQLSDILRRGVGQ